MYEVIDIHCRKYLKTICFFDTFSIGSSESEVIIANVGQEKDRNDMIVNFS